MAFPFHPGIAFAHGKRVIFHSNELNKFSGWLKQGLEKKLFLRFSSHALMHRKRQPVERIGMQETVVLNHGIDLGVFGLGAKSPYNENTIASDGHFGHMCVVKRKRRLSQAGSILVGLENSRPLRIDQQGSNHGANCTPNEWSAFFLPKWNAPIIDDNIESGLSVPKKLTNTMLVDLNQTQNLDVFLKTSTDEAVRDYVLNVVVSRD